MSSRPATTRNKSATEYKPFSQSTKTKIVKNKPQNNVRKSNQPISSLEIGTYGVQKPKSIAITPIASSLKNPPRVSLDKTQQDTKIATIKPNPNRLS